MQTWKTIYWSFKILSPYKEGCIGDARYNLWIQWIRLSWKSCGVNKKKKSTPTPHKKISPEEAREVLFIFHVGYGYKIKRNHAQINPKTLGPKWNGHIKC